MKPISFRLPLLCAALLSPVLASAAPKLVAVPYHDPDGALSFVLPEGWRVHTVALNGKRQWRVVPRKADERERAAIRIWITLRTRVAKGFFDQQARKLKSADGDREAARSLGYNAAQGRLVAEYREGQFEAQGLWLVRRHLLVDQKAGRGVIEAHCSAADAEFQHYKRQLNLVCASIKAGH
jgi:hypothetical protein